MLAQIASNIGSYFGKARRRDGEQGFPVRLCVPVKGVMGHCSGSAYWASVQRGRKECKDSWRVPLRPLRLDHTPQRLLRNCCYGATGTGASSRRAANNCASWLACNSSNVRPDSSPGNNGMAPTGSDTGTSGATP